MTDKPKSEPIPQGTLVFDIVNVTGFSLTKGEDGEWAVAGKYHVKDDFDISKIKFKGEGKF